MSAVTFRAFVAAVALLTCGAALAQGQVLRGVLGNGGAPSSGAGVELQGTAGQPVVGVSGDPGVLLNHGFWHVDGSAVVGVVGPGGANAPRKLRLSLAYPSPSRSSVRFNLSLPTRAEVKLGIYDVSGREVGAALSSALGAGDHVLEWNSPKGRAGVFFGRLSVNGQAVATRRIVLLN